MEKYKSIQKWGLSIPFSLITRQDYEQRNRRLE